MILAGLLGLSQPATATDGKLVNLSTRGLVETGEEVMIGGFIIRGGARHVLIQALGPELANRGVSNALADPVLTITASDGMVLMVNDDWDDRQGQLVTELWGGSPPFTAGSKDSAVVLTLEPGSYAAIVEGKNGTVGVALVEVYDIDSPDDEGEFVNLSTRGLVETGEEVMIGGFIIRDGARQTLIQALGPELANRGVSNALADPVLTITASDGMVLMVNDDWDDRQGQLVTELWGGSPPFTAGSKDSAVVLTLEPGTYTAKVEGKNGTAGVASVEVYGIDSGGGQETTYGVGDTVTDLPTWWGGPDYLSEGSIIRSSSFSWGVTEIELDHTEFFEFEDVRYTCQSPGGCIVRDRKIIEGTIVQAMLGGGSDDHGDNRAAATPVAAESDTPGVLDADDIDWFRVEAEGPGRLEVYTSGIVDTLGRLEDAAGALVEASDDDTDSNFRISSGVCSGAYYVRVRGYSSGHTGSYTMHVRFTESGSGTTAAPSFSGVLGPGDLTYPVDTSIAALTLPAASGGDGTLAYSLALGAPGLWFDPETRQLIGTPNRVGAYKLTYTATDADGDMATLCFMIVVEESGFDLQSDNGNESANGIVYANGRFFVVDYDDRSVYAYTASGDRVAEADFDLVRYPTGIVYAEGRFFVAGYDTVSAYTASGTRLPEADFNLSYNDGNRIAHGITYADDRFFILDWAAHRVFAYTTAGTRIPEADFNLYEDNDWPKGIVYAEGQFFVTNEDGKVFAYTASGDRVPEADFEHEGNRSFVGITYADGVIFVVDRAGEKVYAHTTSGDRVAEADFGLHAMEANDRPRGIAHIGNGLFIVVDGVDGKGYGYTFRGNRVPGWDFYLQEDHYPWAFTYVDGQYFVVDGSDEKVYVYTLAGNRVLWADFDLHEDNSRPTGIVYAEGQFFVTNEDGKVFAYTASGNRVPEADFDLHEDNGHPTEIAYADGRFFVLDSDNVYAYTASGDRVAEADFDLHDENGSPSGILFFDGRFYIVDSEDAKVYYYSLAVGGTDTDNTGADDYRQLTSEAW